MVDLYRYVARGRMFYKMLFFHQQQLEDCECNAPCNLVRQHASENMYRSIVNFPP